MLIQSANLGKFRGFTSPGAASFQQFFTASGRIASPPTADCGRSQRPVRRLAVRVRFRLSTTVSPSVHDRFPRRPPRPPNARALPNMTERTGRSWMIMGVRGYSRVITNNRSGCMQISTDVSACGDTNAPHFRLERKKRVPKTERQKTGTVCSLRRLTPEWR